MGATICIARSLRHYWHLASTCYVRSRFRIEALRRGGHGEGAATSPVGWQPAAFSYLSLSPPPAPSANRSRASSHGEIWHFNGRYWCDYSADPDAPTSWRYDGPLGSVGSPISAVTSLDLSEYLLRPNRPDRRRDAADHDQGPSDAALVRRWATPRAGQSATSGGRSPTRTSLPSLSNLPAGLRGRSRSPASHSGIPTMLGFEVFGTEGAGTVRPCR